jgi:hypothetical protein
MSDQLPTLDVCPFDPWNDTITIEGTRYAGQLFRSFGARLAKPGTLLRIESHQDGVLTVVKLLPSEVAAASANVTRLQGEAIVLRELLRLSLQVLNTVEAGDGGDTEADMLHRLRRDIHIVLTGGREGPLL